MGIKVKKKIIDNEQNIWEEDATVVYYLLFHDKLKIMQDLILHTWFYS